MSNIAKKRKREQDPERKEYRRYLDKTLAYTLSTDIPVFSKNDQESHWLVARMAGLTRRTIDILVGFYPPDILSRFHEENLLHYCINHRIRLRILCAYDSDHGAKENALFRHACLHDHAANCDIRELEPDGLEALRRERKVCADGEIISFFLFDDDKYLIQLSPRASVMSGSFNHPGKNQELRNIFNAHFSHNLYFVH
ncbi:hypothetical protein [Taibaiella koreensis]|uniref:hypothetical protein n=1 Tax=Taibaiella koreensis TaxID=1268548 RepID=UPI000E59FD53|nr:hypothetical protein [Taibaiella koreensis]